MPKRRNNFVIVAAAAVALFATGAHGAVISFSDTEFLDANWSGVVALNEPQNPVDPVGNFTFTAMHQPTGGVANTAYRQVINTIDTFDPSNIGSGHFLAGATFDPGQDGTFASLDMSLFGNSINATAGAMAYGVLLEQSGFFFRFGLGQTLNGAGFELFSGANLVEADFTALNGGVLDLSNSGAEVKIGAIVFNGTFGAPGAPSVNEGGIDNWSATIRTVELPEPGTMALFGLGLAGLGFARRKRML